MKLSDIKPSVESSGEMQEKFFSIEDQGMIFDILRNKMYSNPILAVCREYACNARDAHREVKTPEVSVEIHLPNNLEPEYKIKDFGPGISPDRMENIFIKYTASTKRDSNIQHGGFGLGCKAGFSVSDQFAVETIYNGIKYNYACFIDETKVGKLALMSETKTDLPNSTEIIIPVKPQDFRFFQQYTEQSCRHWDVKPIIKGGKIVWTTLTKILEGKNWAIANSNVDSYGYGYSHEAKLVIDGIEYPLEKDTLRKYADTTILDASRGNLIMYFGVGELSLSASREQIYMDKPTQDAVCNRLIDISKEIKTNVTAKLDTLPNLWDANIFYRQELTKVFTTLSFLGKINWKTYPLSTDYIQLKCNIYSFKRGKYSSKFGGKDPSKLNRYCGQTFSFEVGAELYINDLPLKEPTPKHVKKAFEDDPKLESIILICPNDRQSEKDLNKQINLDQMQPKKLSSITNGSVRASTPAASRLIIFKFNTNLARFCQTSYDDMDTDINDKVLCLLERDTYNPNDRYPVLATKKLLKLSFLNSIAKMNPKASFYGVNQETDPARLKKEFSDFQQLDAFIDQNLVNNKSINYVEVKFSKRHRYDTDDRMLKLLDKFQSLISDPKSEFLARLSLHDKIRQLADLDDGLLEVYESLHGAVNEVDVDKFAKDNPSLNIKDTNEKYKKKYPLLAAISSYGLDSYLDPIAEYVNMKDDKEIKNVKAS